MKNYTANSITIEKEIQWFSELAVLRGRIHFEQDAEAGDLHMIQPPDITGDTSLYANTVRQFSMSPWERFILILSLLPHVRPELLDLLSTKNAATDQPFTELGGQKGQNHRGFLPTGETAIFLLAGKSLEDRFRLMQLFDETHFFHRNSILRLESVATHEPKLSGLLTVSPEYLSLLTTGDTYKPDYSSNFPAKRINTGLDWEDLVIAEDVMDELMEIKTWLTHGQTVLHQWGFHKKIKAGYRALFSGPPGTGKTLTASLLGKSAGMDVYRIDLSMVVSKYIGETEKNLAGVFDRAENKNWILFFDEADALFGKRTNTSDAHDRHANQEVSYLLQRIEDFPGLVILATNFKSNIDEAFSRRFQLIVNFKKPDYDQRLLLWKHAFTAPCELSPDVNLEAIAYEYEVTGAAIMNVLRYCSLKALERGSHTINSSDIKTGIKKEMLKEGKTIL